MLNYMNTTHGNLQIWAKYASSVNLVMMMRWSFILFELQHDKTNEMTCVPSKDSDQPGHPPSLIKFSLGTLWVAKDAMLLHADSEDSDQTGWMPRLI